MLSAQIAITPISRTRKQMSTMPSTYAVHGSREYINTVRGHGGLGPLVVADWRAGAIAIHEGTIIGDDSDAGSARLLVDLIGACTASPIGMSTAPALKVRVGYLRLLVAFSPSAGPRRSCTRR